ncbi:MAG: hypothetical protein IJZ37_06860 [Clostridia bacterium]|nr:hypothetical protein [Clostridia bacterium]
MMIYKRHKILALLLALFILVSALPLSALAADTVQVSGKKGSDFSENTYISGQLQILFDRLVYSDTPYFTVMGATTCGNTACSSCGLVAVSKSHPALADLALEFPSTAYGSGAFVRYAFALIFGTKLQAINYFGNTVATIPLQQVGRVSIERSAGVPAACVSCSYEVMIVENLRIILKKGTPGDLIQARSTGGGNHSMIFLGATETGVTVLHSIDYDVEGIEKNRVVISEMTYESMIASWGQIITLFRADADTYSETWAKGETLHVTHRYTDETGNNCAVCGKLIDPLPQVSAAGAGVYMASVATGAYASYYRSSTKKASISVGTWVTVTGSVTNAVGKTFYLLENGTYVPAEDFSNGAGTAPSIELTTFPSGNLVQGSSFGLRGTVSLSSGLSTVTGYILSSSGTVLQNVPQSTTATSLSLGSSTVNSKLRFGILEPGGYVMMITAKGQNGAMAAKTYPFTVVAESEKTTPAAPSAPTVSSKTSTSVTLKSVTGYEYSKNGTTWQTSPTFTGLSPATTYKFYQRVAATSTSYASPASAAVTVSTDKASSNAPAAPTLSSKTATSVTLKSVTGYEYSKNGTTWQTSPTFTGLSPATTYKFYQRVAATSTANASAASDALTVTTEKTSVGRPSAPALVSATSTSVTLKSVSGYEYSKNGTTWQSSATFTGLSPATSYKFYQRVAETATAYASPSSTALTVMTDKARVSKPSAPTLLSKTDTSVTLESVSGYEYSKNGTTWQSSATFTGLSPATSYTFYQRVAETSTSYASPASVAFRVTTLKKTVAPPEAPGTDRIEDLTVTLKEIPGAQHSVDGGKHWQDSPVFVLSQYGTYTFVVRFAETDSAYASEASAPLSVAVNPRRITSENLLIQEESHVVCGVFAGMTVQELLDEINERAFVRVTDAAGREVGTHERVQTGMLLTLPENEQYTLAVYGDLDGDGLTDVLDLMQVKLRIVNEAPLRVEALFAADMNADGLVDLLDYAILCKRVLQGAE